jgi:hypothetical protein
MHIHSLRLSMLAMENKQKKLNFFKNNPLINFSVLFSPLSPCSIQEKNLLAFIVVSQKKICHGVEPELGLCS